MITDGSKEADPGFCGAEKLKILKSILAQSRMREINMKKITDEYIAPKLLG